MAKILNRREITKKSIPNGRKAGYRPAVAVLPVYLHQSEVVGYVVIKWVEASALRLWRAVYHAAAAGFDLDVRDR